MRIPRSAVEVTGARREWDSRSYTFYIMWNRFFPFVKSAGMLLAITGVLSVGMLAQAQRRGRKYTPPPPTCTLTVTVLRSTNGKPVPNASVILHPIKNGKDDGSLELKSDPDGVVSIDVIPVGDVVRLQVIANGWQTYGQDYPVDADTKKIVVKLKRPTAQYSAYNPKATDKANAMETTTPQGKSTSAKPSDQTPLPQ